MAFRYLLSARLVGGEDERGVELAVEEGVVLDGEVDLARVEELVALRSAAGSRQNEYRQDEQW
jgi:hypothetical protein